MAPPAEFSLPEQLKKIPAETRSTVKAAIRTVKELAPKADEITYRSHPPRSRSAMWKIVRYSVDGTNIVGIGTFPNHATLFFYRGASSTTGAACFRAAAKMPGSLPCELQPTLNGRPSNASCGRRSSSRTASLRTHQVTTHEC